MVSIFIFVLAWRPIYFYLCAILSSRTLFSYTEKSLIRWPFMQSACVCVRAIIVSQSRIHSRMSLEWVGNGHWQPAREKIVKRTVFHFCFCLRAFLLPCVWVLAHSNLGMHARARAKFCPQNGQPLRHHTTCSCCVQCLLYFFRILHDQINTRARNFWIYSACVCRLTGALCIARAACIWKWANINKYLMYDLWRECLCVCVGPSSVHAKWEYDIFSLLSILFSLLLLLLHSVLLYLQCTLYT